MKLDAIFQKLNAERVIDTAKKRELLSHAYLILCGDEVLSRQFAIHTAKKILSDCGDCGQCHSCLMVENLSHPDFFIYPKESGGKIVVSDCLEIIDKASFRPIESQNKVFVLDNMANMNEASQNKLLKVLEEPPQNTYFLMTASKLDSVLKTVQSRATEIYIQDFDEKEIYEFLKDEIADKKKLELVAGSANGRISHAIKLLASDKVSTQFERALNIIDKLESTKTIVNGLKYIGDDNLEIFGFMQMIYRDMLMVKNQVKNLVVNQSELRRITELSKRFSQMTLIESIDAVDRAMLRQQSFVNQTGNIDALMLELLEVKYNCQ